MKRSIAIARVHYISWPLIIVLPLAILSLSWLIAVILGALIPDTGSPQFSGGGTSYFAFALAFSIQAITLTFPLTAGFGVTRREFYVATMLLAFIQSVVFGSAFYLMSVLESATDGWGVNTRMFGFMRYASSNPVSQWAALVVLLMLMYSIGLLVGGLFLRYRASGLIVAGAAATVVFGAASAFVTWLQVWPDIGRFVTSSGNFGFVTAIAAGLAVCAGVGGWATLRRAVL